MVPEPRLRRAEGRYECEVNRQYCFYAGPGDLSVGNAGSREAAGSFPTGRFYLRGREEIAEMVGYSNPGHFAVAFRGKFAMTPGDYKRLVRSEG